MSATIPTARAAHPFLEFRDDPSDMLLPLLWSFNGDSPANPFVAGERRDVFPSRQCFGVRRQGFPQVCRQAMRDATGNLSAHKLAAGQRTRDPRCSSTTWSRNSTGAYPILFYAGAEARMASISPSLRKLST